MQRRLVLGYRSRGRFPEWVQTGSRARRVQTRRGHPDAHARRARHPRGTWDLSLTERLGTKEYAAPRSYLARPIPARPYRQQLSGQTADGVSSPRRRAAASTCRRMRSMRCANHVVTRNSSSGDGYVGARSQARRPVDPVAVSADSCRKPPSNLHRSQLHSCRQTIARPRGSDQKRRRTAKIDAARLSPGPADRLFLSADL